MARNISAAVSNDERINRREWLAALMGCSESHTRVDQAETMLCVSENFTHVIDVRHGLRTLVPAYFNPYDEAQERAYEAYKATIEHFGRVIHREMYGRNWEKHARIPMVMVPERQGDRWNGPILLEVPKKDRARFERIFGQRWAGENITVNGANNFYRNIDAGGSAVTQPITNLLGKVAYALKKTEQGWPLVLFEN